MKAKLKGRFLPPNYIQANYALLHHLTQGSMSVEEYTREFEKLMIKCDLQEEEEQTIVRYLGGLDPKYSQVVELQAYTTFDEVCLLAHKVETQFKTRAARREYPKPTPKGPPFNKGSSSTPFKPAPSSNSHPSKSQAPQRTQNPPQTQSNPGINRPRRCFKCQGLGHIASECPNPRIISLAEWEMSREEEAEWEEHGEETNQEEVIEEADEGELLVLRSDGDGPMEPYHEPQGSPRGPRKRPKVKEKEQNMSSQLSVLPGQTFSHKPGFVELVEGDPGGIISCTTRPLKASDLSFPTSPFAGHSEVVWLVNQKQTRNCALPGRIQHTRFWASVWTTKLIPIATKLWGLKIHLLMNIIKAQKFGNSWLLILEPAGQEGVKKGTIWCIHTDGEPSVEILDSPRSSNSGSKIKEKVQALLTLVTDPPGYTIMSRPGFVSKIANDPEGVSACSDHYPLA